jgi:hypothetical protein
VAGQDASFAWINGLGLKMQPAAIVATGCSSIGEFPFDGSVEF